MKALAIALVAALLLAGCASGKKDDDGGDATGSTSGSKSGSGTGTATGSKSSTGTQTGSGGPGSITVDLTRSTPDGKVPLPVNLTLKATFKDGKGKDVPAPSGAAWTIAVFSGNSTTANGTLGKSGTALPTNITLNLTAAGNHTIRAEVTAPGYPAANDTVLVLASPGGASGVPLFFEGAEGDGSQWTISETVYFVNNVAGPAEPREVGTNHPDAAPWAQATDKKKTGEKSWHPGYTDFQRSRMVSVAFNVPTGGGTLTYALAGGAEKSAGGVEGLFVLVGPKDGTRTVVGHQEGDFADWTTFTFPVPAGDVQLEFRFDSDGACSARSAPPDNPVLGCGEGATGGGYWVDDITVA